MSFLIKLLKFLNSIKIINFYTTANFYSKYFKSTSQINIDNQVGIVIHGNIERKGKFTLNNIKKINKQYANIKIVFSNICNKYYFYIYQIFFLL